MAALLNPAVRLMARLTITRKLLLLSVLFLVPLCGALYAVFNQSVQSIRDTRDEERGLTLVSRALDFMRETQVRRGAVRLRRGIMARRWYDWFFCFFDFGCRCHCLCCWF